MVLDVSELVQPLLVSGPKFGDAHDGDRLPQGVDVHAGQGEASVAAVGTQGGDGVVKEGGGGVSARQPLFHAGRCNQTRDTKLLNVFKIIC